MLLTKLLTPQELFEHRAEIGLRFEVLVRKTDKFGWDRFDHGIRIMLRKNWMDTLQDFHLSEIDEACAQAIRENPNYCPNEGHIYQLIMKQRKATVERQPKPAEPEPFSALSVPTEVRKAYAEKVMREVGYDV